MDELRLYWSGDQDLGGILVVAGSEDEAVLSAHDEICDCGEGETKADCLASGNWSTTDLAEVIDPFRLRLVERKDREPVTPVPADGFRLWWLASEDHGEFSVARTQDEAVEHYADGEPVYWESVDQVRRVDGYDVLVAGER